MITTKRIRRKTNQNIASSLNFDSSENIQSCSSSSSLLKYHKLTPSNMQSSLTKSNMSIFWTKINPTNMFNLLMMYSIFLTSCLVVVQCWPIEHGRYPEQKNKTTCETDKCLTISVELSHSMDLEVNPCDDFYHFTCGRWILRNPIPKYRSSWNQFQLLYRMIEKDLTRRLENRKQDSPDHNNQHEIKSKNTSKVFEKLYQFYDACINTTQRNEIGYDVLYEVIDELGGWPMLYQNETWDDSMFTWEKAFVTLSLINIDYFIRVEPIIDFRNTSKIILRLSPPYQTSENIITLKKYGDHLNDYPRLEADNTDPLEHNKRLYLSIFKELWNRWPDKPKNLTLDSLNYTQLRKDIDEVFDIQLNLQTILSREQPMSYYQTHYEEHLVNVSTIKNMVKFNITYILEKIFRKSFDDSEVFFVPDFHYLEKLPELLQNTSKRALANYFSANMVYEMASHTTTKLITLLGINLDSDDAMSNICFRETSFYLPELLGKLYLELYFDKYNRKDLKEMAHTLRESFKELIKEGNWMDNRTISEAIKKLEWMGMNIAYPDWYENIHIIEKYSELYTKINESNYIRSVLYANMIREIVSHDLVNDKNVWPDRENFSHPIMLNWPQRQILDINAFYYFTTNGVYIPVGILRDEIYAADIPGSIKFGSIGMIMGHEMTHAFDTSGRLYDEHGALRNWWTNDTKLLFEEKAHCFIDQYDNYTIASERVRGKQTLAENIADNGGLRQAYKAFKKYEKENGEEDWRLPGEMSKYTPDQLFFISFAHMWCANIEEQEIRSIIENNSHSPPSIRVKGPLANFEQFAKAFNCPKNSAMNPERKCVLW